MNWMQEHPLLFGFIFSGIFHAVIAGYEWCRNVKHKRQTQLFWDKWYQNHPEINR
jgi:hypothetical protein